MNHTLTKTWWLLALCGTLDAVHAGINLLMLDPVGSFGLRRFAPVHSIWDIGMLALAAAACAIAVGCWSFGKDNSWLLSLHGLALGSFGSIGVSPLVKAPLSFRPISLLFVVMAVSIGAFALTRALTQCSVPKWFLIVAGAASIGFAFSFAAVGFDWVKLGPQAFWVWMSSYFGFCAIFMLWMALQVRSQSAFQFGQTEGLLHPESPRHGR